MKILGINISHHVSFALIEDGEVKQYYEEDRFNKLKKFHPFRDEVNLDYQYHVLKKFKNICFDKVVFASYCRPFGKDYFIIENILKQVKCKEHFFSYVDHHIYHAVCGFYFSKFDESAVLVRDGGGEQIKAGYQAIDSIFTINKEKIKVHYTHFSNARYNLLSLPPKEKICEKDSNEEVDYEYSNYISGGYLFGVYTAHTSMKGNEGELMGLAAYSEKDDINKYELSLAKKAQQETLDECIELIKKLKTYTNIKNVILSGGYHLNCSNNFKLVKHFPELNFFADPIPYDGGTAVGVGIFYANYKK